jgi:hypothetical protein
MLNEIADLAQDIPTITETATEYIVSAEHELDSLPIEHHFKTEAKINPNIHSHARWRWVWAIDKIRISLRVQRVIHALWKRFIHLSILFSVSIFDPIL